ncbi:MAG: LysR substrate-binding domain-containing protein [Pseudomonadota bacterium]
MLKQRAALPRLDYLITFEVAAELESFSAAAKHLNVSETAVSRKIRLLELHFDCLFFERGHRSVRLTDQGRKLLSGVSPGLKALENVSLSMLAEISTNPVRLAATNSVASLWLMPRLSRLRSETKGVTISLLASDEDQECLSEDVDLAILRGDGDWPGFRTQKLFGETVFPVCSPGYLENHISIKSVSELPDHALIEVRNNHAEWLNWQTWLTQKTIDPDRVRHSTLVNTYPLAIQAAADGLGIALGWGHLVDRHLQSGALVRPLAKTHVRTHSGYYMLTREGSSPSPNRDAVAKWLKSESAHRRRYAAEWV